VAGRVVTIMPEGKMKKGCFMEKPVLFKLKYVDGRLTIRLGSFSKGDAKSETFKH
jgi:hypothetical protein